MISKRKKVLLRSVATAIALAAIGAAVKMLVTDHWPSIDPLVSTAWTWTLAALAWVAQPITAPLWLLVAAFVVAVVVSVFTAGQGMTLYAIAYAALQAGTGRWREVHPAVWLVASLFVLRYALE